MSVLFVLLEILIGGVFEDVGGGLRARYLRRQLARGKPISFTGLLLIVPRLTEPSPVRFHIRPEGAWAERMSGAIGTYRGLHAAIEDIEVRREADVRFGVGRYGSLTFEAPLGRCTLYCVPRHIDLLLTGVSRNPSP